MRYLFFANTPAHVHLYKYPVQELQERGHSVVVLGRDDGCAVDLLEYYDLPYELYGKRGQSKRALLATLPKHYANSFRLTRSFDPDLIFGMGAYAAPAGLVSNTPVVAVQDSEPHTLDYTVSRAIVNAFLTPYTFGRDLGAKHYRFLGFKESAYLHPDVYRSECDVRGELGLSEEEPFVLVRFNSWGAYHDVGRSGFDSQQRQELLERLDEHATVIVSDEEGSTVDLPGDARTFDVHPAYVHDALAEASLLVADTQTMVTEAAMLGTPAIRSNSFVGDSDMGNFVELEAAGLVHNTTEFDELLAQANRLLTDEAARRNWNDRHESFVGDLVNLTDLIVDVATASDPVTHLETRQTDTVTSAVATN
jgi:predicted glycosyltransferase